MIKTTTVLKRMLQSMWKPILFGAVSALVITLLSVAAELYMSVDYTRTYLGLYIVLLITLMAKYGYDWTQSSIKYEQETMLKDLGKK